MSGECLGVSTGSFFLFPISGDVAIWHAIMASMPIADRFLDFGQTFVVFGYAGFVSTGCIVFFLSMLLKMAEYYIDKQKVEPKVRWDWVFVFSVKDEDFEGANDVQRCVCSVVCVLELPAW